MITLVRKPMIKEMQDIPETFENLNSLILWIKSQYIFTACTDIKNWVYDNQTQYYCVITWKADEKAMSHNTVFSWIES